MMAARRRYEESVQSKNTFGGMKNSRINPLILIQNLRDESNVTQVLQILLQLLPLFPSTVTYMLLYLFSLPFRKFKMQNFRKFLTIVY